MVPPFFDFSVVRRAFPTIARPLARDVRLPLVRRFSSWVYRCVARGVLGYRLPSPFSLLFLALMLYGHVVMHHAAH